MTDPPDGVRTGATGTRWGWAPVGIAVVLAGILLQRTWLRWNDVLVDYGRELYVPWRLSAGEVLYRDLAWFNGPLSAYVNAGAFRLLGVGYATLFSLNLALLALFAFLLHRLLTRLGGSVAAGVALVFLLPVSFLAHHVGIANYNFVTPYSHELTHGILLATAAFLAALGAGPGRPGRTVFAGFLLGLAFLTKAEVSAAATAGVAVAIANGLAAERAPARGWLSTGGLALLGFGIAPLAAFGLLATAMPADAALRGVLRPWIGVFASETTELAFYRSGMGLDHPGRNLLWMAEGVGIAALCLAPALLLEWRLRRPGRGRIALAVALAATIVAVWLGLSLHPGWIARPLPLVLAVVLVVTGRAWLGTADPDRRRALGERFAWSVLALVLLLKMILFTRFQHYGFVLALPAATVLVLALVAWIPARLRTAGAWGGFVLAASLGLLVAVGARSWQKAERFLVQKTVDVAPGRDRFRADWRGKFIRAATGKLNELFEPEETVLVIPEGIMVNYLARLRTPTPYINFMPPELLLFGEETILEALRANPPAGIVVVHKDTSEYGYPLFGRDYGREIMRWVEVNYEPRFLDGRGQVPLRPGTVFGLMILERREP